MALLITLVSMLGSAISDGTAIRAIRTPPGVLKLVSRSSRRPPPRRGSAVRALTARREVHHHLNRNASWPRRTVEACGWTQTSFRLQSSRRNSKPGGKSLRIGHTSVVTASAKLHVILFKWQGECAYFADRVQAAGRVMQTRRDHWRGSWSRATFRSFTAAQESG